jgi:hypothetical protein
MLDAPAPESGGRWNPFGWANDSKIPYYENPINLSGFRAKKPYKSMEEYFRNAGLEAL